MFAGKKKPKIRQPANGFFLKMINRVNYFVYRFDIPTSWKIHPVLLIVQLKPGPHNINPYDRKSEPNKPQPVAEFNKNWHEYEIEKFVNLRTRKYGKKQTIDRIFGKMKRFRSKK